MTTDTTPPVDLDKLLARLAPKITSLIRAELAAALADQQRTATDVADHASRAAAIAACPHCDELGQIDLGDAVAKCQHPSLAAEPVVDGKQRAAGEDRPPAWRGPGPDLFEEYR